MIAASLTLVALGEGVLLAHRPPPQIVKEVVVVREPAPAPVVPLVDQSVAELPVSLPSESSLSLGQTAYERQVCAGAALRARWPARFPDVRVARFGAVACFLRPDVARRTP